MFPLSLRPGALIEVPVSVVRALAIEESITGGPARLPDWNVPAGDGGFPSGQHPSQISIRIKIGEGKQRSCAAS